jgi:AcrR family transcriptional regulator
MIARRGRPAASEAGLVEQAVLDAAKALFMEQGFGATTIEAIAERAHVTKRTIYRKLADKTAIFEAVVRRHASEHAMPPFAADAGDSLEERLLAATEHLLGWVLQADVLAMYRIVVAEAARFPILAALVTAIAIEDATASIARILAESTAPRVTPEVARFGAEMYMATVVSEPFNLAVQTIDESGLTMTKRERAARCLDFFLLAWNAFAQRP